MRTCLALLCLAAACRGEDQPIRVNTQLVEVDVVVRNKSGAVGDLREQNFTVFDNGKEQKVSFFSVQSPASRPAGKAAPLPDGVLSNRINRAGEETAGATVILWDALNTELQDQTWVRSQVLKYLHTMKGGDPVAVYIMDKNLRVVRDFTDDPNRLIEALGRTNAEASTDLAAPNLTDLVHQINNPAMQLPGGDPTILANMQDLAIATAGEMTDYALRDRVYLTQTALEAIAEHLSGMPGRKKLAWISGSFPGVTLDQRSRVGETQIEVQDFGPQINHAIRALNAANVAVYPMDPRGLTTGMSMEKSPDSLAVSPSGISQTGIDTMNLLANGTGGRAFYGSNDVAAMMNDVLQEDQVTYRLAFYPSDAKIDGAYHTISVKVARKGTKIDEVLFRKGYYALDTKTFTNGLWRAELNELMQNPLEATRLGLRASATPVKGEAGAYELKLALDLQDLHLERQKDRWVGNIAFGTMLFPSASTTGTLETIRLNLTEARLREGLKDGYVLWRKVVVGDFSGTMRVAIEDTTTGVIGSVRVPFGKQ